MGLALDAEAACEWTFIIPLSFNSRRIRNHMHRFSKRMSLYKRTSAFKTPPL